METNETIIARDIVSLGDRKIVGSIKGLTVDCEGMAVDHYLASSASTAGTLVLPFEKALGVGDAFMTVQTRDDFYGAGSTDAKKVEEEAYRLLDAQVFSRGGNTLGAVKSFEYDTTFGTVTSIVLDNGTVFDVEAFMFFTPEFVFVDDGVEIAHDLRQKRQTGDAEPAEAALVVEEFEFEPADDEEESLEEELEDLVEDDDEYDGDDDDEDDGDDENDDDADDADEDVDDEDDDEGDDAQGEDAELKSFLVGLAVTDDVVSSDGEFSVEEGTVLTEELIDEAAQHDALLKLTMSVDA